MNYGITFSTDNVQIIQRWHEKFLSNIDEDTLSSAEKFKNEIKEQWESREVEIIKAIENISGLKVEGEFNVFIFPQDLWDTRYIDENNIEWGYANVFDNCTSIGIAKEIVHCLIHKFKKDIPEYGTYPVHALPLLASEEIRFVLNGESEYFNTQIVEDYDPKIVEMAKQILPYWKTRNDSRPQNIIEFFDSIKDRNLA